MVSIAYVNNGTSIYDAFFLNKLCQRFKIVFLTFNSNPTFVPSGINSISIHDLFGKRQLIGHDSPRRYFTLPMKVFMLRNALKNLNPDVTIACGGLDYGLYSALSRFKPLVLFVWGSEVTIYPRFILFRAQIKYSLKRADLVFVDSDVHLNACIELGCHRNKIIKIPWVDSENLIISSQNVKLEKPKLRNKLGWSQEDPIIICARMHEPVYDVECIIRSIPMILHRIGNARFIFLGRGTLTTKLKQIVHELNVETNVYFTGYVTHEELLYYFKNSNVYVSSSLADGTSASLLEAMACNLCCVVSDIEGNREWVTNMENGLLFPVKSSQILAEKISLILQNRPLCHKLARKGFENVHAKANWQKNSPSLYDSIEKLVQ